MIDLAAVAAIMRRVARAEILPRFRTLQAHQIREKSPGNLVTEADVEAEHALERDLTALLPGSIAVGEEAVAHDPAVLDRLDGAAPVWVLDPVDGTANFAHGRPVFGVMVALVQGGATRAGWILDPLGDRVAMAAAGQGAWLDGQCLRVPPARPIGEMTGSLGYRRSRVLSARVARLVRHGAAAHDYIDLATGAIDFAYFRRLTVWDHAAGTLLFQEAGGYARLIDGQPYRPAPSQTGILLAPDAASWHELRAYIED